MLTLSMPDHFYPITATLIPVILQPQPHRCQVPRRLWLEALPYSHVFTRDFDDTHTSNINRVYVVCARRGIACYDTHAICSQFVVSVLKHVSSTHARRSIGIPHD